MSLDCRAVRRLTVARVIFIGLLRQTAFAQTVARPDSTGATLTGLVFDSLHRMPLAGAAVRVGRLDRRITTDSAGRFHASGLPAGVHQVGFQHAVLDSLGITTPTVSVTLTPGATTRVDLGLPSGRTFLTRLCPPPTPEQRADGRSGILGIVRDAATDAPVPGAALRILWRSIAVDRMFGVRRRVEFRDAVADSSGLYVVCNMPPDLEGALTATASAFDTASAEAVLPRDDITVQHFHLGSAQAAGATLAGTVRDSGGTPLEGAEVGIVPIVSSPGAPATALARTDARGGFTAGGVRPGTRIVEVKHVSFQPIRRTVALAPGRTTTLALTLTPHPVELTPVTVTGKSTADQYGFTDRVRRGGGRFYTRDEIARKRFIMSVDLVRDVPGMKLEQRRGSTVIANESLRQNIKGSTCPLPTFVDGLPAPTDLILNIPAEEIDGVEIYNSPEMVPVEYAGPDNTCGAILIWTNWRERRKR